MPVFPFSSGTKCGFARNRTSKSRSTSCGVAELVAEGGRRDDHPARSPGRRRTSSGGTIAARAPSSTDVSTTTSATTGPPRASPARGAAPRAARTGPGERVRPPRLGEAPDERLLRGVQEEQARVRTRARAARARISGKRWAKSGLRTSRMIPTSFFPVTWSISGSSSIERQVVDAEIAHVLEALVDPALSGAREPRDDDEALGDACRRCGRRRERRRSRPASALGPRVLRDLLVDAAGELLGGVVALRLQELVAGGDLDEEREVAAGGDGQAQARQLPVEDRVELAVEARAGRTSSQGPIARAR